MAKTASKHVDIAALTREIIMIPLRELEHSPLNMRRPEDYTPEKIATLAESIAGQGLLQNLIVIDEPDHVPDGKRGVVAGGKRLEAMRKNHGADSEVRVPCLVISPNDALFASLSENHQRDQPHPVAEAVAFAELVKRHKFRPSAIALRFGVTKRYVEQRLKLAEVHPEILAACRAGEIDLETLQAFTVCHDRFRQFDVFVDMRAGLKEKELGQYDVREAMLTEVMEDDHRLVKFIGLDAYREAGGTFLTDLFSDDDQPTLLADSALVRKLAEKKLKKAAKDVTGWAWVSTTTNNWPDREQFDRVSPVGDEFTPEELTHVGAFVLVSIAGAAYTLEGFIRNKDSAAFETLQAAIYEAKNNPPNQGPADELPDDDRQEPDAPVPGNTMPPAPRVITLSVADARMMQHEIGTVIHWIDDGCCVEEVDAAVATLKRAKQNLDALLLGE